MALSGHRTSVICNGRETWVAMGLRRRRPAGHRDRRGHHSERHGRAAGARTASARRHELDRNLRGHCLREHWRRLRADRIFRNEDRQPGSSAGAGSVSPAQFFGCGGSAQFTRYDRELCRVRARTARLHLHVSVHRGDIGRRTDWAHFLRRDGASLMERDRRVPVVWDEGCDGEKVK